MAHISLLAVVVTAVMLHTEQVSESGNGGRELKQKWRFVCCGVGQIEKADNFHLESLNALNSTDYRELTVASYLALLYEQTVIWDLKS